ncbi:MAG: hypothetical protein KAJ28_05560 [Flavobacteriaceae bacterium]|nr:hypothetical protein [Flavobacteriaceae bacterium]
MIKFRQIVQKNIKGNKVLLLFVITNLVYAFMLLVTIPKVMRFSNGMALLDMMPGGYSAEYILTLFTTLGDEGRKAYLLNQIPIDMFYPVLFGISYCLLLAYVLNKLDKLHTILFYGCFFSLIAGIADYMENFGIIAMLTNYPNISNTIAILTNSFTILKSVFTTIYFVILLIAFIALGIKFIKKRK